MAGAVGRYVWSVLINRNRYLVVIERNGEIIAREAVITPREVDAQIEAANRHPGILLSDGSLQFRVKVIHSPATAQAAQRSGSE